MNLTVITCGSKKRTGRRKAWDIYTGAYFRAQLRWALAVSPPSNVRILSAKYGLIYLNEIIETYDLRMGQPGSVSVETVAGQLPSGARVVSSAGKDYLKVLAPAVELVGGELITPFDGLPGMGYKMSAMTRIAKIRNRGV